MNWNDLLQARRQRTSTNKKEGDDLRNPFEKDYHRIVQSASFRRLQDKTQVFPLDQSDFIRTRLTHSLEVSSLAKSLGQLVCSKIMSKKNVKPAWQINQVQAGQINDLLLCAGLVHDIGNPPFGHYGETTIRLWFKNNFSKVLYKDLPLETYLCEQMKADFLNFEGNAQALRVLTKLHFLVDEYGMNLTLPLLHVLLKYPVSSLDIGQSKDDIHYKKMGYFYAERELFAEISKTLGTAFNKNNVNENGLFVNANKQYGIFPPEKVHGVCRHPLTFLLEAADDIAYCTADIEDAYKKMRISFADIQDALAQEHKLLAKRPDEQLAIKENMNILKAKKEYAERMHFANPSSYALQNWLITLQSMLLNEVADHFVANYDDIMSGNYKRDCFVTPRALALKRFLSQLAHHKVFASQAIIKMELSAHSIITGLLDRFINAVLYFGTDQEYRQSPVDRRLMELVSDNYKQCYLRESRNVSEKEALYLRLLLITDYISGMTDSFAKKLYTDLQGL